MKNNLTRYANTFQFIEEQLSSPLTAQIIEFCESELFQETIRDSEVAYSSDCCYEERSLFTKHPSFPQDMTKCLSRMHSRVDAPTAIDVAPAADIFPLIFEDKIIENDISTPLDITSTCHFTNNQQPFSNQQQFDLSLHQNQLPLTTSNNTILDDPIFSCPHSTCSDDRVVTIIGPTTLPNIREENNLSSMPPSTFLQSHHPWSPIYSFIDPSTDSYLPLSTEGCGIPNGNLFLGKDIQSHEVVEFQGDMNGEISCNDPLLHSYNSINELQALSNESQQHHVNESGSSSTTLFSSEITSMESVSLRSKLTGKLERKEKIYKYMKKRNQRNFSKRIKYACRKSLADSRPRVRGRFVKNDEYVVWGER